MTRHAIEYHGLFADDEGPVEVRVKFNDQPARIPDKRMHPDEIRKLVSWDSNGFLLRMTFDDHAYEIDKYEIDPIKNRLTIHARSPFSVNDRDDPP